MNKSLVIAEKPSVASDIAKALGGFKKQKDVYERDDMVITSAVGHLLKMVVPEKHDIKRGKWSLIIFLTCLPNLHWNLLRRQKVG